MFSVKRIWPDAVCRWALGELRNPQIRLLSSCSSVARIPGAPCVFGSAPSRLQGWEQAHCCHSADGTPEKKNKSTGIQPSIAW